MAETQMEGGRFALLRAPALRREAIERGLDSTGKRRDLILRLVAADQEQSVTSSSTSASPGVRGSVSTGVKAAAAEVVDLNPGRLAEAVVRALKTPQPASATGATSAAATAAEPAQLAQPVMPASHDVSDVEVDVDESPRDDCDVDTTVPVDADPYSEVGPAVSEDPYAVLSEDPYGGMAADPSDNADVAMAREETTCEAEDAEQAGSDVMGVKGELSAGELSTMALTTAEGTEGLKTTAPIATNEKLSRLDISSTCNVATSNICEIIDVDDDFETGDNSTAAPLQLVASPSAAQLQVQRRLRLRKLLQVGGAGASSLKYPQLLEKLHAALACSKVGVTPEMHVPTASEIPVAAEAAPKAPFNIANVDAQNSAEAMPDISENIPNDDSVIDVQKAAEATSHADETMPDVATDMGQGELLQEAETTSARAGLVDGIYRKPDMPLTLLRAYANRAHWISLRDGFVIFEEDGVQYPASTPTPMRKAPGSDQHFDLVSLWLLVALRWRYNEAATPALLQKLKATRIPESHISEVLNYLSGQRDGCTLLPVEPCSNAAEALPMPLTWHRRFAAGSTCAPGFECQGMLDVHGGTIQHVPSTQSETPFCSVTARVADADGDEATCLVDVATENVSKANAGEDVQTRAAEAAAATKIAVDADADLCRLEGQEALLTQMLEDCGQRLAACVQDIAAAEAHCRRLHGDDNAIEAQDDGVNPSAAKRPKRCGGA